MLCTKCKKNTAVVFINKLDDNGKKTTEGLCYQCAKELGINPIEALANQANLSQTDLEDMTKQFETMFQDLSENKSPEELNNMMYTSPEEMENMDPTALGSIFSGIFGGNTAANSDEAVQNSDKTQKVKVNQKQNKKKKALDTYGTNLTIKAKNNQLDMVVGRDKEIQRIIQI